MNKVIQIENIGKQYRLGLVGTGTLSHDLNRWWSIFRGKGDPYLKVGEDNNFTNTSTADYVWALNNISFDVYQGQVLGIIGHNGAGKSTLLKILSRVTGPSSGSIKIKGRIGSLLEVGTGFHPELTGRENIFLNGAILGMTKSEIQSSFDEIVDFSGIESYIDTPVKRYSSGMYVRLAFAVAAHLRPEILIVDEVLAVGDAEFQKRCLGKMKDVSSKGRTVLFVSHNMGIIKNLCDRALVLDKGRIVLDSDVKSCVETYLSQGSLERTGSVDLSVLPRQSNLAGVFKLVKLEMFNSTKKSTNELLFGEEFSLKIRVRCDSKMEFSLLIAIDTMENQRLCTCISDESNVVIAGSPDGFVDAIANFNQLSLLPGRYRIHLGIHQGKMGAIDFVTDAIIITIQDTTIDDNIAPYKGNWGIIRHNPNWEIIDI